MKLIYNESQLEAINHSGPPLLIVAGAGSGKTATLVGRVTNLVKQGVSPDRILMLTFTNKAAKNMVQRSAKFLQEANLQIDPKNVICAGTFHSIAYQFLHRFGTPAGYFRQEYVLGEYQTKRIWEKIYNSLDKRTRSIIFRYRLGNTAELTAWHSRLMTGGQSLEDELETNQLMQQWEAVQPGVISHCFLKYKEFKRDLHGMDYDDILLKCIRMFEFPELLNPIISQFDHMLVDEYQDTSKLQAGFLKKLSPDGNNLVVVGDPKQSIYHFLSAEVTNLTKFDDVYPNAKEIQLLANYRSYGNILAMANQILEGSQEVANLHLAATKDQGFKPHIHKYGSERMEARGLLRDIQKALETTPPGEIAVLSRLSSLTFSLERSLVEEGIPYVKVGGLKLMNKLNIRQFIAFLEVALDRYNWLAWETMLPMIPLIGKELTNILVSDLRAIPEWEWNTPPPISLGSGKRWQAFQVFWNKIKKVAGLKELPIQEALDEAFDIFKDIYSDYWEYAPLEERQGKSEEEEEEEMVYGSKEEATMEERLAEIRAYIVEMTHHRTEFLASFLDKFKLDDSMNQIQEEEKITLSTIHSAKGLEWDVVFVTGLEEGSLPVAPRSYGERRSNAQEDEYDQSDLVISPFRRHPYMEEERRLFYVACTRAKRELHITFSSQRRNMGRKESPFLKRFKPKGAVSGTTEGDLATFTLEKMQTEEEAERFHAEQNQE